MYGLGVGVRAGQCNLEVTLMKFVKYACIRCLTGGNVDHSVSSWLS